MRRFGLLTRFAVLSTFVVVALGVVLLLTLRAQVEERALRSAQDKARAIALAGVQEGLSPSMLQGFAPSEIDHFQRIVLGPTLHEAGVRRIKVFGPDAQMVFSDDRSQIGDDASGSAGVRDALMGATTSKRVAGAGHADSEQGLLEVYLPLRFQPDGRVDGVFEVYLDYAPVARAIRQDARDVGLLLAGGLLVLWLALFRIVAGASRRLQAQAEASDHAARHDALTGLPNRVQLREAADAALAGEHGDEVALALIDLHHFKDVNDTLGHRHGDELLVEVAERLRRCAGEHDLVARLGGDEFAILLRRDGARAEALATTVRRALGEPIDVGPLHVRIDASAGIARATTGATEAGGLLRHADVAMDVARAREDHVAAYVPELDPYSVKRLELAAQLPDAIERGELVVFYQPIVDAQGRAPHGVEALVRWQHPELGLLPPFEFIPIAERTGAMAKLTEHVIEQAVRDAHAWSRDGLDLAVACNLGPSSATDRRLVAVVADVLARHPIDPSRLTLELSEDTVVHDPELVGEVLRGLHGLGVRLALDDFGTGSSSIAHLQRLPLDQLKIDRSFVMHGLDGGIVDAMLALARTLCMETVAEGVEDAETADQLAARGCDRLQGFHFQRPVPGNELRRWLAAQDAHQPTAA